jgi:hypothetical protein
MARIKSDTNLYNDLGIEKITENIDRTITVFGKKKLFDMTKYRYCDKYNLKKNVDINLLLWSDDNYIDYMKKKLDQIKLIEKNINDWIENDCDESLIFKKEMFNNRIFLNISNKFKFSNVMIILLLYLFLYFWLFYIGIKINPMNYVEQIITGYKTFFIFLLSYFLSDPIFIHYSSLFLVSSYVSWQVYCFYQGASIGYEHYCKCCNLNNDYDYIVNFLELVENMHKKDKYFNDPHVEETIEKLKKYFSYDSSLGYRLVKKITRNEYTDMINKIVNYVGKIDARISIMSLLDQAYSTPTFVEKVSKYGPVLNCENMWNPLIPDEKIVFNSINFGCGKNNTNMAIITGPNKSGKSILMKTLLVCCYLSQSIGVSPCHRIKMSPFKNLYTYLNVPDCVGRESLFEAEIERCYQYIEKIKEGETSIGIVDELFTGTNPKEGMAGSFGVIRKIRKYSNNITLLTTHYHDMIRELKNENIQYKKFHAKKYNDKWIFDYKMRDGISDQCIALELLREKGFDNEIVDNAIIFMNHLDNKKQISNNNNNIYL